MDNEPKKDPKPEKKVFNAYKEYLKCLQDCKGDKNCEDRCGKRWEDAMYAYIYRFKAPYSLSNTQN